MSDFDSTVGGASRWTLFVMEEIAVESKVSGTIELLNQRQRGSEMQLSIRKSGMFGILLLSVFGLSASSKVLADATAQPFTCGPGMSASIVSTPADRKFTIGKTGKVVEATSFGGDEGSKAGMDVRDFREPNQFSGLLVYVNESLARTRNQVNTRFCFSDKDGDFTVTRQLKDYQFQIAKDGWVLASVNAFELPPRAARANLKRFTMILKPEARPAVIRIGDVIVPQVDEVGQLLTENAGCDGAESCKKSDKSD